MTRRLPMLRMPGWILIITIAATTLGTYGASAGVLDKIKKAVKDTKNKAKHAREKARTAVEDADDEMREFQHDAAKNFDKAGKEIQAGLDKTAGLVKKQITTAQEAAYTSAARAAFAENREFLSAVGKRWERLLDDPAAAPRVVRMLKKAAKRQSDEQSRADMRFVIDRLLSESPAGTAKVSTTDQKAAPAKHPKWLQSISVSLSGAGGYYVGGEASVGLTADVSPKSLQQNTLYEYVSGGGLAGLVAGGSGGVTLGFWPTTAADSGGGALGVFMSGAYEMIGGGAAVQWNITDKGQVSAIPGFAVGYAGGMGVEAGFMSGYTLVHKVP